VIFKRSSRLFPR